MFRELRTGQKWRTGADQEIRILFVEPTGKIGFVICNPYTGMPEEVPLTGDAMQMQDLLERTQAYLEV